MKSYVKISNESKGPIYRLINIFGFCSNWSFLPNGNKNGIRESDEKKCGMRDFREKDQKCGGSGQVVLDHYDIFIFIFINDYLHFKSI